MKIRNLQRLNGIKSMGCNRNLHKKYKRLDHTHYSDNYNGLDCAPYADSYKGLACVTYADSYKGLDCAHYYGLDCAHYTQIIRAKPDQK